VRLREVGRPENLPPPAYFTGGSDRLPGGMPSGAEGWCGKAFRPSPSLSRIAVGSK
jgi:hypothetical protein